MLIGVALWMEWAALEGFYRASGDCECPTCGEPYRKHPFTPHRAWHGDLHLLCTGDVVKL
jgi:hypothetical protein